MDAIAALTTRVSGTALVEPGPDDLALADIVGRAGARSRPSGRLAVAEPRGERLGARGPMRRHPDAMPAQIKGKEKAAPR